MANSRKVVQIFLASPGDLQDERQTAKAVVDAFNKHWADWFDIQIELVGWEDTFKRFGRPQAQINLDLDRCEAFIGLMWRKWGTSPGGDYTSGFEEEFERALAGRKKSTRPEMTLFFKKIDEEFLKDRGPDLIRVLDFRQRVIKERQILFHDFDNLKDFENKLTDWVVHYVKHLKKLEDTNTSGDEKVLTSEHLPDQSEIPGSSDTPLSLQGAQFVRNFVAKTERDQKKHPIDAVEIARFRLIAGMIGMAGNDENLLGTHDANLLFQNRDRLDLSRREMLSLVDAGLDSISSETIPLWNWYDRVKGSDRSYLCVSTLIGPPSQRVGALIAMRLIGEPIVPLDPLSADDETSKRSFFPTTWLSARTSEGVKTAALQYLSAWGEPEDLPILKIEYEKRNYQTVGAAADAFIRINLRQSREKAMRALIELQPEAVEDRLIEAVFAKPATLETKLLLEGTAHRNGKVRAQTASILLGRNALPTDIAEKLLEDSDAKVRFEALRSLERAGREFSNDKAKSILVKPTQTTAGFGGLLGYPPHLSDKEGEALWASFQKARLRSQSEAALITHERTLTISDPASRFALDFKFFRQRASALRVAIDDLFQKEFASALQELAKANINTETLNKLKSAEEALRKNLVRYGTDILCEKGEAEDLERIRRIVSSGFVTPSILDIDFLKKHGEWQDISLLVSMLDRSEATTTLLGGILDDGMLEPVALAVYAIGKKRFGELSVEKMPSRLLRRILGLASDKEIAALSDSELIELYHSEETDVRRAVLLKSVRALPKTRLKRLLTLQLQQDRLRYYNVSYWLDLGISLPRKQILHVIEMDNRKR